MSSHAFRRLLAAAIVLFSIQTTLHGQEKLPLEVVSISPEHDFDILRLHNTGKKAITAYHFEALTNFSDGTASTHGSMTDFTALIPRAQGLEPGVGPIRPGEIRDIKLAPRRKENSTARSMNILIDAVVFEDATYAGPNITALQSISDHRATVRAQLTEWIAALEAATSRNGGDIRGSSGELASIARSIARTHKFAFPGFEEDLQMLLRDPPAGQSVRADTAGKYIATQKALRSAYERHEFRVTEGAATQQPQGR